MWSVVFMKQRPVCSFHYITKTLTLRVLASYYVAISNGGNFIYCVPKNK